MIGNTPRSETVFSLEARKSFALGLHFIDRSNNDEPVNLDGSVVRFVMSQQAHRSPGGVLIETEAIEVDYSLGLVQIEIQPDELDLPPGEYPFAISILTDLDYDTLLVKGYIDLQPNADPTVGPDFTGINPSTNLAVYREEGVYIKVQVAAVDGLATIINGLINDFTANVQGLINDFTSDQAVALGNAELSMNSLIASFEEDVDTLIEGFTTSAENLLALTETKRAAAAVSAAAAAASVIEANDAVNAAETWAAVAAGHAAAAAAAALGEVEELVNAQIEAQMAVVDDDAGSTYRVQQDARLEALYAVIDHDHIAADITDFNTAVNALVTTALNALIDGAPGALNTLNELAAAVNDDATFAASVTAALSNKANLSGGRVAFAELGTGAADGTKYLRDDRTWQSIVLPALVSQVDAEAGSSNTIAAFSPLRVAQAIAALGGDVDHTHEFEDISGLVEWISDIEEAINASAQGTYANAAPGAEFAVLWDDVEEDWINQATSNPCAGVRPSARSDIFFRAKGGGPADADPTWGLYGDERTFIP